MNLLCIQRTFNNFQNILLISCVYVIYICIYVIVYVDMLLWVVESQSNCNYLKIIVICGTTIFMDLFYIKMLIYVYTDV